MQRNIFECISSVFKSENVNESKVDLKIQNRIETEFNSVHRDHVLGWLWRENYCSRKKLFIALILRVLK